MIRRPVRRDFNASVPILQVLAITVVIGVARRPDTGFAGVRQAFAPFTKAQP